MKDRILIFINYLNITTSLFEKRVNLSNGFVSNIGSSVRNKSILKISSVYPELNINWWKTGEGSMLKNGSNKLSAEDFEKLDSESNLALNYQNVLKILEIHNEYQRDQRELRLQLKTCQSQLSESQKQITVLVKIIQDNNAK